MKPLVSLIIPCYNEQATIRLLLDALLQQTYPLDSLEVLISDGMSSDQTRAVIAAFQDEHPELRVRVVDNPRRNIPAALNAALAEAQGEIVVRSDAHSVPDPAYIENNVAALQAGLGDVVGGVWQIRPGGTGWVARSIAAVAAHPLGVGDALYRYTTRASQVDTVPFGAFRRELAQKVGGYDERLLTNEDYEFNTRVRQSGGHIYLDPAIRSIYFARGNFNTLARQYWRYGYWKFQMLRRYPKTLRWRQALPPLLVAGTMGLALLALVWPLARLGLAVELGLYFGVLILAGAQLALKKKDAGLLPGTPLGIATMHFAWGAGFLWSLVKSGPGLMNHEER